MRTNSTRDLSSRSEARKHFYELQRPGQIGRLWRISGCYHQNNWRNLLLHTTRSFRRPSKFYKNYDVWSYGIIALEFFCPTDPYYFCFIGKIVGNLVSFFLDGNVSTFSGNYSQYIRDKKLIKWHEIEKLTKVVPDFHGFYDFLKACLTDKECPT